MDVQSDLLQGLDTRVVVPLRLRTSLPGMQLPADLMPVLVVEERECVMETPKLAVVPARLLRAPVANLSDRQLEIGSALDFLLHGF